MTPRTIKISEDALKEQIELAVERVLDHDDVLVPRLRPKAKYMAEHIAKIIAETVAENWGVEE